MASSADPQVRLGACTIIGRSKPATQTQPKPVDVFFNIPYATAQRFEHPVEDPALPETLDARKEGGGCPTLTSPGDEDCLHVNVTRPAGTRGGAALPVLVYIHGGAFNFGTPLERDMGAVVAWSREPFVAVSVAYRLGVLGFPPFDGDHKGRCNLGLRDQAAALRWVDKWIGAFGGDREKVTAVGASAGAHSIGHHLLSPSPPLFHKAILESGSPTARLVLSASHPRTVAQYRSLLEHGGCSSLADLELLPVGRLIDAANKVWSSSESSVQWPFQPVVDGEGGVITDLPIRLWEDRVADGRARNMRLLTGFCSDEGISFVPASTSSASDFRAFFTSLIPALSPADLDTLEGLYPDPATVPSSPYNQPGGPQGNPHFRRLGAAYGDFAYIAPVLHTAHVLSRAGARVYVYEYAAATWPLNAAAHGSQSCAAAREEALLSGVPGVLAVAAEMHGRMTRFVTDPAGDLGDSWPAFGSPEPRILVFGQGNDELSDGMEEGVAVQERVLTEDELNRMRFWWERMELVQGMGERAIQHAS